MTERHTEALERLNQGIQESRREVQQRTMSLAQDYFGESAEALKQQIKEDRATLESLPDQVPGGREEAFQTLFQELMDNYSAMEESIDEAQKNVANLNTDQIRRQGEIDATDAARREAKERGVDLTRVEGTGSDGRIIVSDVVEAAEAMEAEDGAAGQAAQQAQDAAGQAAGQAQQVAGQATDQAGQVAAGRTPRARPPSRPRTPRVRSPIRPDRLRSRRRTPWAASQAASKAEAPWEGSRTRWARWPRACRTPPGGPRSRPRSGRTGAGQAQAVAVRQAQDTAGQAAGQASRPPGETGPRSPGPRTPPDAGRSSWVWTSPRSRVLAPGGS